MTALAWAASILAGACLSGAMVASDISGTAFYLLALLGLGLALRAPAQALVTWRRTPELCLATLLLIGLNLASVLVFELPARAFSWTPLLAAPLIALLAGAGAIHPRSLYAGGALGTLLALAVAMFDWIKHDAPRPTGEMNAIVFGQIALVCALYALAGLLRDPGRARSAAYLVGVAAGIAAMVASGTRGALVALPVLVAFALRRDGPARISRTHRRVLGLAAVALALAVSLLGERLGLGERLTQIDDEVAAYQEGEVGTRAVALRLALWAAALELAAEHPTFGVGAHRFRAEVENLQTSGDYPGDATVYAHAHNTALTVLAEYGVIGMAVLVLATGLAWRGLARSTPAFRRLGRAGLLLWLVMSLTNDLFAHQNTLRILTLGLAICAAMPVPEPRLRRA